MTDVKNRRGKNERGKNERIIKHKFKTTVDLNAKKKLISKTSSFTNTLKSKEINLPMPANIDI